MNDRIDDLVFQFLNGDLSDEGEREALARIAEDPDGRALLKLELGLQQHLAGESEVSVPEGFVDRTMVAVEAAEAGASSRAGASEVWSRWGDRLAGWIEWATRPQPVRLRPAYGLALLLLVAAGLGLFGSGIAPSIRPGGAPSSGGAVSSGEQVASGQTGSVSGRVDGDGGSARGIAASSSAQTVSAAAMPERVPTRFVYVQDQASSVAVAGDFNDWEPVPMHLRTVNGHRVWSTTLRLREGEHQYMFVVDGEKWVTDPLAPVQREDGFGNRNAVITL